MSAATATPVTVASSYTKKYWLLAVALLLLILVSFPAWFYWRAVSALPQVDGTLEIKGISQPVEILRDAQGVPHIRAQNMADLLFAQGYVTAQDRLWQM